MATPVNPIKSAAAPAPAPPAKAVAPPTPEQLATERLQRNGYTSEQITAAISKHGADSILTRQHRLECGNVGNVGKAGNLGSNALKD